MHTFYRLTDNPFALTPDPKFFYWSPTHRTALQLFVRNQQRRQGILVVTGARGTGKTTLLQAFATLPEPRTRIVSLPHAASSMDDLSVLLAQQMGRDRDTQRPTTERHQSTAWIRHRVQARDIMLLLLDNAHEWSESLLADIEVFARLGTPTSPVCHIILAGPRSLLDFLKAPRLAPLRARIGGMIELSPLDLLETQAYIRHRLTVAGCPQESLFTPDAVDVIYRYTQGIPRTINQLCSQVLLAGCAAHVPRIEAEIVQHVATRMGLPAPAPVRPAPATPASHPLARHTPRWTAPATPQPTVPRTRWPSTARQPRGRTAHRRPARLPRVLLPLGVTLLMVAGSVVRLGGELQEGTTPMLAAPFAIGQRLPVAAEPLLPSGRALEAEADTIMGAGQPHPTEPDARETQERREPQLEQEAEPSPPATSLATARTMPLRTTEALPHLRAPGAVSVKPSATLQRPPQPGGTTRLAKMPRAPLHALAQPLSQPGFAASRSMPPRANPVALDTADALEHSAPTRYAQRFQHDLPLGAAPSTHGAPETQVRGQALDVPETMQPRLPLSPPTAVPEQPAVLPRSPEPLSQEAAHPAPHVPTTAEVMARPVPGPSFQGRTVEIHTGLAQTSVLINGVSIGPAPVVIHLPLGVYTMAIDRPGSPQITWKMQVDPNGVALHMTKSGGWSWPSSYTPRVVAH
jgi:type II secretory pathway predicted ATPase ExeA